MTELYHANNVIDVHARSNLIKKNSENSTVSSNFDSILNGKLFIVHF